jgi:SAM-dependent methyltransferase
MTKRVDQIKSVKKITLADLHTPEIRCFLCDDSKHRVVHSENGYEARQCNACGTLYPYPPPPQDVLDPRIDLHEPDWYRYSSATRLRWLSKRRPAPLRLLDIGCGDGSFVKMAINEGYDANGIEPHPGRSKACREAGLPVETVLLEEYAEKTDRRYDVVFHVDLLAHFADPIRSLKQMVRLLAPGGMLCFEVGALGNLSPFWYKTVGGLGLPQHLWLYSVKSLGLLMERAGLEVVDQTCFGLSGAVALGRGIRSFRKIRNVTAPPLSERADTPFHKMKLRAHMAVRYKVGALLPPVGPLTYFFLVRPK